MALKGVWEDKVNGKDRVKAQDVNTIAKAVMDLEEVKISVSESEPIDGSNVWIDTDEDAPSGGTLIDVVASVGQVIAVNAVDEDGKPTKYKAVDLPEEVTPDFAADEGEKGHILNRTHYVDKNGVVHKLDNKFIDADWMATKTESGGDAIIISEQTLNSGMWTKLQQKPQAGETYDVYINGVCYPCEARGSSSIMLGNDTSLTLNNYPFCIMWAGGSATSGMFFIDSTLSYPIKLKVTEHKEVNYNKLPEEFLPDGIVKTVNGSKPDEKGNVSISTGGGGDSSIDVTAEVGQTIVVEEVDGNGKPTKWKAADYQPRTHWTENATILPETVVEVDPDAGMGLIPVDFTVEGGKKYTVKYNGVDYVTSCLEAEGQFILGNGGALIEGLPVTEDPFILGYTGVGEDDNGVSIMGWLCVSLDGSASVTLSIAELVYHTIPHNYLDKEWAKNAVADELQTVADFCDDLDGRTAILEARNNVIDLALGRNQEWAIDGGFFETKYYGHELFGLDYIDLTITEYGVNDYLIRRLLNISGFNGEKNIWYDSFICLRDIEATENNALKVTIIIADSLIKYRVDTTTISFGEEATP